MALEIKRIAKLNGDTVTRVISPGTIFQLFKHAKKTSRDFNKFQKDLNNEKLLPEEKELSRSTWEKRIRFVNLIQD